MRRLIASCCLLAAFSTPLTLAQAQLVSSLGAAPQPVEYTLIPEVPGPSTQVTITAEGVGGFLGNSQIAWAFNGKTVQQGTGDNSFSFTTGPLGVPTSVGITIRSQTYGVITQSWNFNPSLVNLVWEAQTTVPPFYMGKALYSAGSGITVFAFPEVISNGVRTANSALSFQWKVDDQPQTDKSGLGRSQFSFSGNELIGNEKVDVDVLSGNTILAHDEAVIPATNPQILFYARDPLRGILYGTALPSTYQMPGTETTVHAEPYYFSKASAKSGSLAWAWTINGNPTSGPNSNLGELTLRAQGQGAGTAILGASLQNSGVTTFMQAAQASLSLLFGSQKQTSVFGI